MNVTFITGNPKKAEHLERYLKYPVKHLKLELDELQSLDSSEILEHKVRQAYKACHSPVLVEDVSLIFKSLGGLPGSFIKWLEQEIGLERICRILDFSDDRSAIATVTFAYNDGHNIKLFEGSVKGKAPKSPQDGPHAFGWNPIFMPEGHDKTYAEMDEAEIEKYGLRPSTVFPQIREFLSELDSKQA